MQQSDNQQQTDHISIATYVFFIWTFVIIGRPQDYVTFLVPFRLALVFTALTLITTFASNKISIRELINKTKINKRFFNLYLIMWLGIPLAVHRFVTLHFLYKFYIINVFFFYLFYVHIDTIGKLKKMTLLMCLTCFSYGAFTLLLGKSLGGRIALGSMFDPNDLAHYIVALFPAALFFLGKKEKMVIKVLAILTLLVAPVTVFLTGSRGGFLALLAVVILFYRKKIEGIKKGVKIGIAVLICLAAIPFASKINMDRFTGMTDLEGDYNLTSETGRKEVWKTGMKLILHHPITGVGASNFARAFGNMRGSEGRTPVWKTAHNSYIQICAEIGIFGFYVYMSIIYLNLKGLREIEKLSPESPHQRKLIKLSTIMFMGYIGNIVGAFFLSQAYSLLFTLYFAMSVKIPELLEKETQRLNLQPDDTEANDADAMRFDKPQPN